MEVQENDMNYADRVLKNNIEEILLKGSTDANMGVRPRWSDGKPAYTYYVNAIMNKYDLSRGEFPLTTLRPVAWKTGLRELLWIYQDKSNDVNLLKEKYGVNYWDSWKKEDGTLGTAYGYQMAKEIEFTEGNFTQIDRVIHLLKNDPMNRRIMTNMIHFEDMRFMALVPCAFMTMWSVRECPVKGKLLDMTLVQRSNDLIAAQSINASQYAMLLMMIAQVTGHKPGIFTHFIQNMHIYDRHIAIAHELLSRENGNPAIVTINPSVMNFEDFRDIHFEVSNYNPHPQIKNIEIAI